MVEARKAMLELAKAMREMTCIHPEADVYKRQSYKCNKASKEEDYNAMH